MTGYLMNLWNERRSSERRVWDIVLTVVASWPVRSVEFICWLWMCAWAGCLAFNHDLVLTYRGALHPMLDHFPQPIWATFAVLAAGYEAVGLARRFQRTEHHRRTRRRACMVMAIMFGALAGELAAADGGVPAVYGLAANAVMCLFAFARLDLLPDGEEATRGC